MGAGKRLRPFLVWVVGQVGEADAAALRRVGAAIELIHAYSLIHDDLPAMDDATLRRGRPSCHMAFDEATAILAGDALQALAFEALAREDWPCEAATPPCPAGRAGPGVPAWPACAAARCWTSRPRARASTRRRSSVFSVSRREP